MPKFFCRLRSLGILSMLVAGLLAFLKYYLYVYALLQLHTTWPPSCYTKEQKKCDRPSRATREKCNLSFTLQCINDRVIVNIVGWNQCDCLFWILLTQPELKQNHFLRSNNSAFRQIRTKCEKEVDFWMQWNLWNICHTSDQSVRVHNSSEMILWLIDKLNHWFCISANVKFLSRLCEKDMKSCMFLNLWPSSIWYIKISFCAGFIDKINNVVWQSIKRNKYYKNKGSIIQLSRV